MSTLSAYLQTWRLKLSHTKTVTAAFHLNNREAKRELKVYNNSRLLPFCPTPTYLGVKLDRSLTFRHHLVALRKKLSSRVTLLRRLVGSGWGAGAKTLRIATLSLVYSTAEYCAPVWCRSAHTRLIDNVLNDALRIVTGCLSPTPTDHLSILSGIQPAELRRMGATLSLAYRGSLDPDHILHGLLSGSSLMKLNLVMESIENKMLKDFAFPPRIWLRYIDDTFVVLKKTEVVSFYKFINNIEESIKFTVEQEVDNAIPFLDVLIIRNNGQLTTKAYRKPTHTTRYLNFNSCHNFSQKVGLVKTLLFRAKSKLITNYRDKINEVKFVCNALRDNDYPDWLLNKMKKEIKHKKVNKIVCMSEKISNYYVGLPYIKGLSDKLSRILRKFNINVYTYPYKTIGNILPKIKDSVDDIYKRGAIYKIPCKDCSNVYVGETGRCFNTRLSEHKRDLKPINLAKLKEDDLNKKTALVKHCFNCEHRIDFGNFEILDYNIDYDKRKFLESLYINNTKNSINDKDRNVFPKIYSNIKNLN